MELTVMFHEFRREQDEKMWPDLVRQGKLDHSCIRVIYDPDDARQTPCGFVIMLNGYLSAVYVVPEKRRKGLGTRALLQLHSIWPDLLETVPVTWHVSRNDDTAKRFFESVYSCIRMDDNGVDQFWKAKSLKVRHLKRLGLDSEFNTQPFDLDRIWQEVRSTGGV